MELIDCSNEKINSFVSQCLQLFFLEKSIGPDGKTAVDFFLIEPDRDLKENEVNDIILKIEMKKFQKLIENRALKKNSLLKSDIKRLYPMCNHPLTQKLKDVFSPELNKDVMSRLGRPREAESFGKTNLEKE